MPGNSDEHETDQQHEQLVSAARPYDPQATSREQTAKLLGVSGQAVGGLREGKSPIDAESGV
jgi:hypothetical protein